MIKALFRRHIVSPPAPALPPGLRVYAIGDIHGCADEFEALLALIDADDARRPAARTVIVLLGDLVDRGPDSARVIARARRLRSAGRDVRGLLGNHEEFFLAAVEGDRGALRLFARNGGRETALSYGIDAEQYDAADFDELAALLRRHVPAPDIAFLRSFEDVVELGDYAFVHAGIRPGVPLANQSPADLRWIRDRFLDHSGPHERFVVHGHTITPTIDDRVNRLGIDTGAFASGILTAVGLEGDDRWFLDTATPP